MIILPSNRPVNTNLYSFELFITISFKYFNFNKNICLIHKFRVSQIRFLILMKITFEKRKRKGRLSYLKKKGGYELSTPTMLFKELGVCRKPTDPSNLTQPNPTHRVRSVFKAWWVGLGYKKKIYSGSGWV